MPFARFAMDGPGLASQDLGLCIRSPNRAANAALVSWSRRAQQDRVVTSPGPLSSAGGSGDNRGCTLMPTRRHYRRPNPDRRRALELLAASRHGYGKAILRAHGFSVDMLVELVKGRTRNHEARAHGRRRSTDRRCARADHGGRPASARKDVQVSLGQLDP